jgi:hypothetical protein
VERAEDARDPKAQPEHKRADRRGSHHGFRGARSPARRRDAITTLCVLRIRPQPGVEGFG